MTSKAAIRQREFNSSEDRLDADLNPILRRILLARNVTSPQDMKLDLRGMLPPGDLSGIETAADIVARAVMQDRKILIVGDFDADGATGSAVAVLSLQAMGCRRLDFRA